MKIEKFKVLLYLKRSVTDKRDGQVGQSPDNGKDYGEPVDGAIQLQAILCAGVMEREGKSSRRQEPGSGGDKREDRQAADVHKHRVRYARQPQDGF